MDPAIVLFGLGVGVLVGATGMGGGALMTPLLILIFGVKPVVAVGTDLSYAAVTKTVGGIRHLLGGQVHRRMALTAVASQMWDVLRRPPARGRHIASRRAEAGLIGV